MKKNTFNFRKVLVASALLAGSYAQAQFTLPTVTTGTTHCTTTGDDCATGAYVTTTFSITVGELVQFTAGDFKARVELYRGDWTSQGLAGHIVTNETFYSSTTSPAVTVADVTTFNFKTLSFFSTAPVFLMNKNGAYRGKTILQQKISGVWTDVFTTPLSPIYGANDQPPFNTWGDMGEVAFIQNMKIGTNFNYSVNGLYQSPPAPLTIATCIASPLTLKNITGTMGNPGSATLTVESGTLSTTNVFTSLSSTVTTFGAENNNDVKLNIAPFSLANYTGALRITYKLPDDECYGVVTPVVKTTTVSVVTAQFLDTYKNLTPATTGTYVCSNSSTSKDIAATVSEIVTTMPTNANFNMFQCALRGSKGWQGATTVGIKGIFTGSYVIDVYEVNSSGVRLTNAPSIYLNSGQITPGGQSAVDVNFNSTLYGAAFDAAAQYSVSTVNPADITGNGGPNGEGGNFFFEFYKWAKYRVVNNIDANALTAFSAKIFCAEVNQYPAGGCVVSKKSFFRIANNGTGTGQNARYASFEEEAEGAVEYVSLDVFPNPTTGELNIPMTADDKDVNITIMDNLGKQVLNLNNVQNGKINIEKLTSGIYFYTIQKNGEVYRGKVVKD